MICTEHGIEHTAKLPCEQYEKYRQLSGQAHSVTEYRTREIEGPDGEWLGVEQVEGRTLTAGWTGNSELVPLDELDNDAGGSQ